MIKDQPFSFEEVGFIKESNNIEDIFDDTSLIDGLNAWRYIRDKKVINHFMVKYVHGLVMANQPLDDLYKGEYRHKNIHVGGYEAPHYSTVEDYMSKWLLLMNGDDVSWKDLHIMFEKIHPFVDGNGRVGRLLMHWYRRKVGLPVYIVKASERQEYYKWFKEDVDLP